MTSAAVLDGTVRDGLVCKHCWDGARLKILWLLKDAHIKDSGWVNLVGGLLQCSETGSLGGNFSRTWTSVAKVSYGLLTGDEPRLIPSEYLPALRSICVMNISKTAGGRTISEAQLRGAFQKNQHRLRRDLDRYSPDVVIGGSTLAICAPSWLPPDNAWLTPRDGYRRGRYYARLHEQIAWIHAHHPQYCGGRGVKFSHSLYLRAIGAALRDTGVRVRPAGTPCPKHGSPL